MNMLARKFLFACSVLFAVTAPETLVSAESSSLANSLVKVTNQNKSQFVSLRYAIVCRANPETQAIEAGSFVKLRRSKYFASLAVIRRFKLRAVSRKMQNESRRCSARAHMNATATATATPTPQALVSQTPTPMPTNTPTPLATIAPTTTQAPSDLIDVKFSASRTSCVAPCGVYFDATATTAQTTNNPFQELNYLWNFGDPAAIFRNQPSVDANAAVGGVTGHVFAFPGTYHVTLTVHDAQGYVASKSVDISVADPEFIFSPAGGGHTWCVASDGDFSGCPSSDPADHFTDYTHAIEYSTLCEDGSFTHGNPPRAHRRVVLKRGQTFIFNGFKNQDCFRETGVADYDNFYIMLSAFGQGADPVIRSKQFNYHNPQTNLFGYFNGPRAGITITGISFQGLYDASTGTGEYPQGCLWLGGTALQNATIYRNSFSGCEINMWLVANGQGKYPVIADNISTNWQNFGMFGEIPYSAVLANLIEQRADTLNVNWDGRWDAISYGQLQADFPNHGAVRVGASTHTAMLYNNFTSRNSWIGLGSQPSLRFSSDGPSDVTHSIIAHNRLIPGAGSGGSSNGIQDHAGKVSDIVWDGNLVVLQKEDYYGSCLVTQFGGTTFRNNICLKLPTNQEFPLFGPSGSLQSMFQIGNPGPLNEETLSDPIRIYNNTLISLDEKPGFQAVYNEAMLTVEPGGNTSATPYVFDIRNNLVSAPQLTNFFAYWFFASSQNPLAFVPRVISARNIFSVKQYNSSTGWGPTGQGTNSTQDPRLAGLPLACRPALTKRLNVKGATITGNGLRSFVTKAGANFGGLTVLRNSRIEVLDSSAGPLALIGVQYCKVDLSECSSDPAIGPAYYGSLSGLNVFGSNEDTLTLPHDIRTNRTQTFTIDLTVNYSPSTTQKVYMWDNSPFQVGNKISYGLEATARTVASVGSDGEGQYITVSPALPERASTFICKWDPSVTPGLNFHLSADSPARDGADSSVPVFQDFAGTSRPIGPGLDIGAYED